MTVVSDRIARVLTDLGLLELQSLIYQRLLTGKNYKLKSYGISGQIVGLISSFLSKRWLQVVLDGKSSQEYPVNAGFLKDPFLVLHFSYYTLMTFLMMLSLILPYMLMVLLSILSGIRHLVHGNN